MEEGNDWRLCLMHYWLYTDAYNVQTGNFCHWRWWACKKKNNTWSRTFRFRSPAAWSLYTTIVNAENMHIFFKKHESSIKLKRLNVLNNVLIYFFLQTIPYKSPCNGFTDSFTSVRWWVCDVYFFKETVRDIITSLYACVWRTRQSHIDVIAVWRQKLS